MRKKRVDCFDCANFVFVEPIDYLDGREKAKYSCKLGKRVMFRMPKRAESMMTQDAGGFFRYCNEFQKKDEDTGPI